jgi:ATP-dependent Lhr-like helicase
VRSYEREWLDQITLSGELAWVRLWGSAAGGPLRRVPMALVAREDLSHWLALSAWEGDARSEPAGTARQVYGALDRKGALFAAELRRATSLPPADLESSLAELVAQGHATCDSFAGLRWLMVPRWRRTGGRGDGGAVGRWSPVRRERPAAAPPSEFVARQLLHRTGVVFRKTLAREKQPLPWRDVARACRLLEARGEIRGGRFVAGFDGEQYALPEAVTLLRALRKRGDASTAPVSVSAADPLNLRGILTPDPRVSPATRALVQVG